MAMNEQARTRIGYARVSTGEQDTTAQIEALQAAGCQRIYTEHASGSRTARPELDKALDHLRPGDVFTVWKLDRLGRSLPHLIETVQKLESKQVDFLSLTEAIDTTALLQRLAAVRGRLSLCADQAAAAKWWLSMPMASVSAEGPMPKALSTRRTSPLMPGCRHQGRACPLRRARMTSNPLIVA